MGLEAGTYLNDLVAANPLGGDPKGEGDNHIRLIKSLLLATFPGFAGRFNRVVAKSTGAVALTESHTVMVYTAAGTAQLVAAATLGNGWMGVLFANGGDVTIDPNAAELVNGAATLVIPNGSMALVYCDGTGFLAFVVGPAAWTTGDIKVGIKTVADFGWVMMNDGTIGNAASGATTRANADTVALFTLLYNGTIDANCAVSGGRGANAAADYAANKTITLPKVLGRALAVAGAGAGLTARALAVALGHESLQAHTHTGTTTSDGSHSHQEQIATSGGGPSAVAGVAATGQAPTDQFTLAAGAHTHTFTSDSTGAGNAQNMPPETFFNVMIKL